MDGVWFCFYSKLQERLDENQMHSILTEFTNMGFANMIKQAGASQPKIYRGYIHICWSDYYPKSSGIMGNPLQHTAAYWRMATIKPVEEPVRQAAPIKYTVVE